ncbi:hypothetical protein ES319_A03G178900v1 [Gossypium barbadense]|uniref:Uncharacterized protein n=1 Tax=Gossypium barbadense TaxID=3634 RepID=A0A5J5WIS2_GOSBA|nr:hypothetical protein ES319_A03G178900v1 [Gossypium barbadense]
MDSSPALSPFIADRNCEKRLEVQTREKIKKKKEGTVSIKLKAIPFIQHVRMTTGLSIRVG